MTDLVAAPPGVSLFVCDMPAYCATGDDDVLLVWRDTALGTPAAGDEPTAHDIAVARFLEDHPDFVRAESSHEEHPDNGKVWQFVHYQRPGAALTRERYAELTAPMAAIADRRAKLLTRLNLM